MKRIHTLTLEITGTLNLQNLPSETCIVSCPAPSCTREKGSGQTGIGRISVVRSNQVRVFKSHDVKNAIN